MPQPVSYNTGNPVSGSIQDNNIAYVVDGQSRNYRGGYGGLSWMSEVSAEGNIIFVGNTTSVGRGPAGKPLFYPSATDSDADIIAAANNLPGSPGNLVTVAEAYDWAVQNGFFIIKSPTGRFFGDSLNYYVDASQPGSYPEVRNTWYDLSGRSANGTLVNGPTFVRAGAKGAIRFDGTNDKVETGATPTSLLGDPPLTVCAVVKRLQASVNSRGVWGIGGNLTDEGINCWNSSATNQITIDTWNRSTFTSGTTYPQNRYIFAAWQKVPGSMTRANCTIWRNNVSYTGGQLTVLRAEGPAPNYNSQGITLGSISSATTYCVNFDVSDFKVYDKVLTEDELLQVYYGYKLPAFDSMAYHWDVNHLVCYESGSTSTYDLTQETTGTLFNGTGYAPENGGAWDFDGTNDYIGLGNLGNEIYHISLWVYLGSPITGASPSMGLFYYGGPVIGPQAGVSFGASTGFLTNETLTILNEEPANTYQRTGITDVIPSGWNLITFNWNGSSYDIYINAEKKVTSFGSSAGHAPLMNASDFELGSNFGGVPEFDGRIGMMTIYDRALTAQEIGQYYQETQ